MPTSVTKRFQRTTQQGRAHFGLASNLDDAERGSYGEGVAICFVASNVLSARFSARSADFPARLANSSIFDCNELAAASAESIASNSAAAGGNDGSCTTFGVRPQTSPTSGATVGSSVL